MDPVSVIVTALVLGLSNGLKTNAEQVVRDGYLTLRKLIEDRYKVNLSNLEENGESKTQQEAVRESLELKGVADDKEVLEHASRLLEGIHKVAPDAVPAVLLVRVKAKGGIDIEDVTSQGPAAHLEEVETKGDIKIKGIKSGGTSDPN